MSSTDLLTYQEPPKEILEWADAQIPPVARINSRGDYLILLYRERYLRLQDLYAPELKLAGIRLNPITLTRSQTLYYTKIQIQPLGSDECINIQNLPEELRIIHIKWSPDEKKLAFTNIEQGKLYLWVIDFATLKAWKVSPKPLNAILTIPFIWHPDSSSFTVLSRTDLSDELLNRSQIIPDGPVISEGHQTASQHRTYQDLLKDKTDEVNFFRLAHSHLTQINLSGEIKFLGDPDLYDAISYSPNGRYLLLSALRKPFSYHVPFSKFPHWIWILDTMNENTKCIEQIPLQDTLPKGFMAVHTFRRDFRWRYDKEDVLTFSQALDDGNPHQEVEHRDAIYQWAAPFDTKPELILRTVNRYSHILWSERGYAMGVDYWYDSRNTKTYLIRFVKENIESKIIMDRDYQDRYGDPGEFLTENNQWGRPVLAGNDEYCYLTGDGYNKDGIHPFIDKYNLQSGTTTRLWQAAVGEELIDLSVVLNVNEKKIIIRKETATVFPNYYALNWDKPDHLKQITQFTNPFESLNEIKKSIIKYKRKDGTELYATLYLPDNTDPEVKLPMLMWAYPEEYTDKRYAGQVTSSPQEFTYPWYGSPVFWVRRGYAVLDEVSFPIIGTTANDINDSFIEQLRDNASAAIDAVCDLHPIDRNKIAVGGHSYGAFMTANLLTWTSFFAAGIARSGAYNRTLTPFGFQGEQRTYWEVPDLYHKISPFGHADKVRTPLLLIHGMTDSNSGTFTLQSQRYYDALKSLGADVRLVLLPREGHNYRSRESILHILWEQDRWLEKHLKPSTK